MRGRSYSLSVWGRCLAVGGTVAVISERSAVSATHGVPVVYLPDSCRARLVPRAASALCGLPFRVEAPFRVSETGELLRPRIFGFGFRRKPGVGLCFGRPGADERPAAFGAAVVRVLAFLHRVLRGPRVACEIALRRPTHLFAADKYGSAGVPCVLALAWRPSFSGQC